jgi:thioredoxin-related protein
MEILMVGATWCQPCKNAKKYLEDRGYLNDKVQYNELGSNKELEQKYGVRSLPTFILVDGDRNEVEKFTGYHADKIEAFVKRLEA